MATTEGKLIRMKHIVTSENREANHRRAEASRSQPEPGRATVEGECAHASNLGARRETAEWRQLREAVALGGDQSIEAIARVLRNRRSKAEK